MDAELIAIGTEILLGQIDNSHARYLSRELAAIGIAVYRHGAVGDNVERARDAIAQALERSDIVIVTGGLGPTEDDVTRVAVAAATGQPLTYSEEAFERYVAPYFSRLGRTPAANNRRQAMRIGEAEFLPNPRGTAPGQYVQSGMRHIFLLPGPPLEMRPMFVESVRPLLVALRGAGAIFSRVIRLFGIGESDVEQRLRDLLEQQGNPTIAPLAGEGEMVLRLTASAADEREARRLIAPLQEAVLARVGQYVYGYDDETLPVVLLRALAARGETVACAESCTGGALSSMIVDIPGCSSSFRGAVVAYDNAVKVGTLGVLSAVLEAEGAVSEEAARRMARGVRRTLSSDWGVAVTGIAGPDGGTPEKPVGLVYIAIAGPTVDRVCKRLFPGDRAQIRVRAAKTGLHELLCSL